MMGLLFQCSMREEWKYIAQYSIRRKKLFETKAEILDENSYAHVNEKIYFLGDCQEKCKWF